MPLTLTTAPTVEPVTLAEAKVHLRVDTTDEDDLITSLITSARIRAEWHTGRALITQSWTQFLDCWPQTNCVEIALPPLQNLNQIRFFRADDTATDLDAILYEVDSASSPARVALKPNANAPANLRSLNAIALDFTAGYGDAEDVPQAIRQAILELIAWLHTNRGEASAQLPQDIEALLAPYRIFNL